MFRMRWVAGWLGPLLIGGMAGAQVEQAGLEELLQRFRESNDYRARHQLVHRGYAAVPGLVEMLRSDDERTRMEAHLALGWVAHFLVEEGRVLERRRMAGTMRALLDDEMPHVQAAAAELLGQVGGREDVSALAARCHHEDLRVREGARAGLIAMEAPQATQGLLNAARREPIESAWRARLIEGVGDRGDFSAVPDLMVFARLPDPPVRVATARALGRLPDRAALPVLSDLAADRDEAVRQAAVEAALQMGGRLREAQPDTARSAYLLALQRAQTPHQQALALAGMEGLATARDVPALAAALRADDTAVQVAAVSALATVPGGTRALDDALPSLSPPAQAAALQVLSPQDEATAAALSQLRASETPDTVRIAALDVLGRAGGPGTAAAVIGELGHPSYAVRQAAARAAIHLGDPALTRAVLDAEGIEEHTLADALHDLQSTPEQIRVEAVRPFLEHPSPMVRQTAFETLAAHAGWLARNGRGKEGMDLMHALLQGRELTPEAARRMRDAGIEIDFAQLQGFITRWWIIGPFPSPAKSAYERSFFPEQAVDLDRATTFEGRAMSWESIASSDSQGRIDLLPCFQPNENVAAYAYTEIAVDQAQDAVLKTGSDDGMVVWLNGERVFGTNADRGMTVDEDVTPVRLNRGRNTILLKVLNGGGGWGYVVRLVDREGRPLPFEVQVQ